MRKSYIYKNLVGTLGYHYMKGFYRRLRKAKVMSKKMKNLQFYY
jgi:hypothetical protein